MLLHLLLATWLALLLSTVALPCNDNIPRAHDSRHGTTYTGIHQDDVENFFSVPYAQSTSGSHRFKPPRPFIPSLGATIDATERGPACPQPLGNSLAPLYLSNITEISEDCLHLNIYRPNGTSGDDGLPVLLIIHGGALVGGSKDELLFQPAGLILQSVENGLPVLAITMNYRLGVFGFAQSDALLSEGATNAGLRDQRLAIEWARDNIKYFGGDPEKITLLGQSSGGHSVGMQLLAYGGDSQQQSAPFHQAIAQSQLLDLGITGNITQTAMRKLVAASPCNSTTFGFESAETVQCLRNLPMTDLLAAQTETYAAGPAENAGDVWLPVIDGDFLPAAPSKLIAQGRFTAVPTILGWTDNDGVFFIGSPTSEAEVRDYYRQYLPGFSTENLDKLLSLYPVEEFTGTQDANGNVLAQTYRSGRILRDVVQTCQPLHFGRAISKSGSEVYVYDQNQTILEELLLATGYSPSLGPVHTAEMAYLMGNLSHYDVNGYPFGPEPEDFALKVRQSRSWSSFVSTGRPSLTGRETLQRWEPAFRGDDGDVDVFVIGGAYESLSASDGRGASVTLRAQRLRERCAFINLPEVVGQLLY